MTTQERIIKTIISELRSRYRNNNVKFKKELAKLQRFVKSSEYFKGSRKSIYKIIIKSKKDS